MPFTYATSFLFSKESTAQNFTLFLHMVVSAIGAVAVFLMRMVQETESQGDLLSYILKFLVPSFAFTNSMLYTSNRKALNETRNYTEGDRLKAELLGEELLPRTNITLESFDLANMGGDFLALAGQSVVFLVILILIETGILMWFANIIRCRT